MPKRDYAHNPIWRLIGFPIVQWLSLTGMLVVLSLVIAGGIDPHRLIDGGTRSTEAPSPFALESLRERLPADAVIRVQGFVQYYRENRRRGFKDSLARSTRYVDEFKTIFREAKLPEELAFLPLIESGFIENAVSPMNAVGVYQFIEETGRRYDLKTSRWYDLKLDPIHSAHAAAKYFGHLYERFGNWELALAAYNSGEGTVSWALRKAEKAGTPKTFWHLDLPDETRAYVPAFLAAMLIAKNPSAYGFNEIDFHPQVTYEQIQVNAGIPLSELAAELETDEKSLRALNPSLLAGITPPGSKPYMLRVPFGLRDHLEVRSGRNPGAGAHRDWLVHQVESRDTLQRLAAKFRTDSELIKTANGISTDSDLKAGRLIVIPL